MKHTARILEKKLPLIFLSMAVFFLPFSLIACHIALIFFLIISVMQGRTIFKVRSLQDLPVILLIALFCILVAGMFYTDNLDSGWKQLEKKIFFFSVPITIAFLLKPEREEVIIILSTFVISCLVASVFCLVNFVHQMSLLTDGTISLSDFNYLSTTPYKQLNPASSDHWMLLSYRSLASGIAMHPTYLSLYLAFSVIIIIHFFDTSRIQSGRARLIGLLLIAYFSIFIIFLSSRIIIVALSSLLIFTILRNDKVQGVGRRLVYAFMVTIVLVALILVNPVTRYRCYQEFLVSSISIKPGQLYKNSTEIRASLWWVGLKSIRNINWVWGSGTGKSQDIMKETSDRYQVKNILMSDNPHSQFVCTVLQHGIIGLLVLIAILVIPMVSALSRKEYLIFGFCSLVVLSCLTETVLERQKGIDFFAVFYPVLLFYPQTSQNKKKPDAHE
ncbi:MAG TPA: O-antigen ligase family protein [Cyclobacteriaceae bacterium]|nr:O-antigen ligase family protein [Cyclobacteriaceae bacterium]